jgi:hypothetical protein
MEMPLESKMIMNKQSTYKNSRLFMTCMKEHSVLLKTYKILLTLDGQECHRNKLQMLEFAKSNNIVLFCLHPQTTNNLQPSPYGMTFSPLGRRQSYCP